MNSEFGPFKYIENNIFGTYSMIVKKYAALFTAVYSSNIRPRNGIIGTWRRISKTNILNSAGRRTQQRQIRFSSRGFRNKFSVSGRRRRGDAMQSRNNDRVVIIARADCETAARSRYLVRAVCI